MTNIPKQRYAVSLLKYKAASTGKINAIPPHRTYRPFEMRSFFARDAYRNAHVSRTAAVEPNGCA